MTSAGRTIDYLTRIFPSSLLIACTYEDVSEPFVLALFGKELIAALMIDDRHRDFPQLLRFGATLRGRSPPSDVANVGDGVHGGKAHGPDGATELEIVAFDGKQGQVVLVRDEVEIRMHDDRCHGAVDRRRPLGVEQAVVVTEAQDKFMREVAVNAVSGGGDPLLVEEDGAAPVPGHAGRVALQERHLPGPSAKGGRLAAHDAAVPRRRQRQRRLSRSRSRGTPPPRCDSRGAAT